MCDFAVGLSRQLLRADDRQRTAAAPPDRAMASAGTGGRDHGLQFPRGRLGLERHDRPGLRRYGGLEALGEDALVRHGLPGHRADGVLAGHARRAARRGQSADRRGRDVGQALAAVAGTAPDLRHRFACAMGRAVAQVVAARLGRSLLELSGNNGHDRCAHRPIWTWRSSAIVFAAVGTAGQRCTDAAPVDRSRKPCRPCAGQRLLEVYGRLPIGHPMHEGILDRTR